MFNDFSFVCSSLRFLVRKSNDYLKEKKKKKKKKRRKSINTIVTKNKGKKANIKENDRRGNAIEASFA